MTLIRVLAFTSAMYVVGCAVGACASFKPTPKQEGAIAEASCTVVDAFAGGPLEQAICATADELIAMEADVRADRSDGGAGKLGRLSGKCKIIPSTTVCATDSETAMAIRARKAARK